MLRDEAHELVGREGKHAEHALAHDLGGATDTHVAGAKLVLEPTIDTLASRAFVVTHVLRTLGAHALQASTFRFALLREHRVAARVDVDQGGAIPPGYPTGSLEPTSAMVTVRRDRLRWKGIEQLLSLTAGETWLTRSA